MDKDGIRQKVWDELDEKGIARFPFPPHGRIPNFKDASTASKRLSQTDEWNASGEIKSNPDSPQRPIRQAALFEGKKVYMAVPRLSDEECFIELDPEKLDPEKASTIKGADQYGEKITPAEITEIDLVVVGSVAVNTKGHRIGKGEGYSDLEYAILREIDVIESNTPVATTVHEAQIMEIDLPQKKHDVSLDLITTPERTIEIDTQKNKPSGIIWSELTDEKIEEIPILAEMR